MSEIFNITLFGLENISPCEMEDEAVNIFNQLVVELKVAHPRIRRLSDLQPYVYASIFQRIFGFSVPDIIQQPSTLEHNIQNVQAVIDALSLDVLSLSLSEITGEDIVSRKPEAVYKILKLIFGCHQLLKQPGNYESGLIDSSIKSSVSQKTVFPSETEFNVDSSNGKSRSNKNDLDAESSKEDSTLNILESHNSRSSIITSRICHLKQSDSEMKSDVSTSSKSAICSIKNLNWSVKKPLKRISSKPATRRSVLMPRYMRKRRVRRSQEQGKRNIDNAPQDSSFKDEPMGILSELQRDYPGISLEPATKRNMRKNLANHIKLTTNRIFEMEHHKSKSQKLLDAAILKQRKLKNIAEKEKKELKTLNEFKDSQAVKAEIQAALRNHDFATVKARQYYKDLYLQNRRIMSQKSTKEEVLLQGLFVDRLNLQKQQLFEVQKEFRSFEDEEAAKEANRIASLECRCENQIEELKEDTNNMRSLFQQRKRERTLETKQRKRELREKRLKEVREIQKELQLRDDFHFRMK